MAVEYKEDSVQDDQQKYEEGCKILNTTQNILQCRNLIYKAIRTNKV